MDGAEDPSQFFILSRIVSIELSKQFFFLRYIMSRINVILKAK